MSRNSGNHGKIHSFLTIVFCIFILCLCAAGVGVCEETEKNPIVVQAGDVCYRADRIQYEVDALIRAYEQRYGEATKEAREEIVMDTVGRYAMQALVKLKARDLKLDKPDESTELTLENQAQQQYEQYWQTARAADTSGKMSDEQITRLIAENGITLGAVYEQVLMNWQITSLLDYYKFDVSVSDEDVMNYYQEYYVKPCRERYENNVPLFEQEVLYGDGTSAYAPEGYRLLYQICIPIPKDIQEKLDAMVAEAGEHGEKADEIYNEIAAKALNGEDVEALRESFRKEKDRVDQLEIEYGALWRTIPDAVRTSTDEIYARILEGETFKSLMGDNPENTMLMFHPDSLIWPDDLRKAAQELESPGDLSLPVLSGNGVHILYYDQDAPGGAVELTDENLTELRYEAEQSTLLMKMSEMTEPWQEEYGLTMDIAPIHY